MPDTMTTEWSATSATKAYLDTLKLCNNRKRQCDPWKTHELGSSEFVSALAAGTRSKLIVEVTSGASPSTIALAAAARQTGGRLVCILPEPELAESKKTIKDLGLKDLVEFRTGDPSEILHNYKKIDFSLVDCKNDDYTSLLKLLDVNPKRSVVVANNLVGKKKGFSNHLRGSMKEKVEVRSLKHPIGKGMEVTMIGRKEEIDKRAWGTGGGRSGVGLRRAGTMKGTGNSKWVVKFDKESGEEHIFRVPKSF